MQIDTGRPSEQYNPDQNLALRSMGARNSREMHLVPFENALFLCFRSGTEPRILEELHAVAADVFLLFVFRDGELTCVAVIEIM